MEMNEPLSEADLNESIGVLVSKVCIMYPDLKP